MIDTYDEAARKAGVTLVPSSGFDSIPSDLGVDWMARRVFEASGLPTRRVSGYVSMRGAFWWPGGGWREDKEGNDAPGGRD